jgi:hypothetical protein
LTRYDDLLKEARDRVLSFQQSTAREYIPRMYAELRKENSHLALEDVKDRIEKDCNGIWSKRTILDALPDEAKNPKRQELGRLGQKKRNSAAITAASEAKREVTLDIQGRVITESKSSKNPKDDSNTRIYGVEGPNITKPTTKCPNCVESDIKIRELQEALSKATSPIRACDIQGSYIKEKNDQLVQNNLIPFQFSLRRQYVREYVLTNYKKDVAQDKVWFQGSLDIATGKATGKVIDADIRREPEDSVICETIIVDE